MNLAINALLAHAPCDQLCILRPKIEDYYSFVVQKGAPLYVQIYVQKRNYNCNDRECQNAAASGRVVFERLGNELFQNGLIDVCKLIYIQAAHAGLVLAQLGEVFVVAFHLTDANI